MTYLLDTCVISELVRSQPHPSVMAWIEACGEETLFLSVITLGEIQKGISKLADSPRKESLRAWLAHGLTRRFAERILPVDVTIAGTWGTLQGEGKQRGETLPVIDCFIAATALVHNLIVVTRNVQDLRRCGAAVTNPWEQTL